MIEAHEKKMSVEQAAKYSGRTTPSVLRVWKILKLEPHYRTKIVPLPQSKIDKINEAIGLDISLKKAAEYAGVSASSVRKYSKIK